MVLTTHCESFVTHMQWDMAFSVLWWCYLSAFCYSELLLWQLWLCVGEGVLRLCMEYTMLANFLCYMARQKRKKPRSLVFGTILPPPREMVLSRLLCTLSYHEKLWLRVSVICEWAKHNGIYSNCDPIGCLAFVCGWRYVDTERAFSTSNKRILLTLADS